MSPLGRGGMGRVYKAFDRVMEEHVALKVLRSEFMRDPEMSRRFVSEIKLARKIGHRNVCRIHEYGEDGDIRFIVMELLSGVTLKEYLHDEPLPPDSAYDVSIQVARGLNAVHELGIVHRDVKTANIMIDETGVAKLVDFGIAKEVSSDLTDPSAAGMIMCTPEYMSPEQVHGRPAQLPQRHLRAGVRRLRAVHRPRPVPRGDAGGHLPDAPARRPPARRRGRGAHPAAPRPHPGARARQGPGEALRRRSPTSPRR